MTISSSVKEGVLTVSLDARFDFDSVEMFRTAYEGKKPKSVEIDFRNTDYMDSSGLGMLLNLNRYFGESIEVRLVNCRPQVKKILLISRFESKFYIS